MNQQINVAETDSETGGSFGSASKLRAVRRTIIASMLLAAGVLTLFVASTVEERAQATQIWKDALVVRMGEPLWDGAITIRTRQLTDENFSRSPLVQRLESLPDGDQVIGMLGLDMREHVVAVELKQDTWLALLESGRMPTLGTTEVLAGPLCRFDRFKIDGLDFEVVGRLQRGTAGFAFSYLAQYNDMTRLVFENKPATMFGWVDPEGLGKPERFEGKVPQNMNMVSPLAPTVPATVWLTIAALGLIAAGGTSLTSQWLPVLATRALVFRPLGETLRSHPHLFMILHALNYGALAAAMAVGLRYPLFNLSVLTFVSSMFFEGELNYIGSAYLSRDIVAAAAATFANNFLVQTCALTILPSMLLPFVGLVKTMASLAVVGFAMAPNWTGLSEMLTYHSITLILEVEAYTLATFAVCVYPAKLFRGWQQGSLVAALRGAAALMGSATLMAGIVLFVAAFYEAITLILIG